MVCLVSLNFLLMQAEKVINLIMYNAREFSGSNRPRSADGDDHMGLNQTFSKRVWLLNFEVSVIDVF